MYSSLTERKRERECESERQTDRQTERETYKRDTKWERDTKRTVKGQILAQATSDFFFHFFFFRKYSLHASSRGLAFSLPHLALHSKLVMKETHRSVGRLHGDRASITTIESLERFCGSKLCSYITVRLCACPMPNHSLITTRWEKRCHTFILLEIELPWNQAQFRFRPMASLLDCEKIFCKSTLR